MKRILLKFYMDVNLGDDLMVNMLLERFPHTDFYIHTKNTLSLDIFSKYPNLKLLEKGYLQAITGKMKFDAYMVIGGSVLDYNSFIGLCYQIKEVLFGTLLAFKRTKTVVIGANTTSFAKSWYSLLCRLVFVLRIKLLSLITVRDLFTYEKIKKYGKSKTRFYPDIVFGYQQTDAVSVDNPEPTAKTLGISVFYNRASAQKDIRIYRKIAEIANAYLRKGNRRVTLFGFDTDNSNDSYAVLQVYRMLERKDKADMVLYYGDSSDFLKKFKRCDAFITVRFHALVLALKLRVPFIPIIYANKTQNLLTDLDYKGISYDFASLPDLDVDRLMDELENSDKFILSGDVLDNLSQNALGHFKELEDCLNE